MGTNNLSGIVSNNSQDNNGLEWRVTGIFPRWSKRGWGVIRGNTVYYSRHYSIAPLVGMPNIYLGQCDGFFSRGRNYCIRTGMAFSLTGQHFLYYESTVNLQLIHDRSTISLDLRWIFFFDRASCESNL